MAIAEWQEGNTKCFTGDNFIATTDGLRRLFRWLLLLSHSQIYLYVTICDLRVTCGSVFSFLFLQFFLFFIPLPHSNVWLLMTVSLCTWSLVHNDAIQQIKYRNCFIVVVVTLPVRCGENGIQETTNSFKPTANTYTQPNIHAAV